MDFDVDTLFWEQWKVGRTFTHARVVGLSPVTTGPQTQKDLRAYSNPSGSELPNQTAAVSRAELWDRKKDTR